MGAQLADAIRPSIQLTKPKIEIFVDFAEYNWAIPWNPKKKTNMKHPCGVNQTGSRTQRKNPEIAEIPTKFVWYNWNPNQICVVQQLLKS